MFRSSGRSSAFLENADRRSVLPLGLSFEEILSEFILPSSLKEETLPVRTLLWGDETGALASWVAGWMALKGFGVIVLDGANRFDPYKVSLIARKAAVPPDGVLKGIQVARAFTSYQMETLIVERLPQLLEKVSQKPWVILLGAITPFGDEDLSDREVGPLLERILKKMEELSLKGIPLLLFQSSLFPSVRREYLMKKLFSFSDGVWKVTLESEGLKWVLQKKRARSLETAKPRLPSLKPLPTERVHG